MKNQKGERGKSCSQKSAFDNGVAKKHGVTVLFVVGFALIFIGSKGMFI